MARPATGVGWKPGGFQPINPMFLERGGNICVLTRDARGAATNMSPHDAEGAVAFSPFAVDGKPRGDLLAGTLIAGKWVANTTPNDGWFNVGPFKEGDGPKKTAKIDTDEFRIEQDTYPYDVAIVGENEPFSFIPVETANPLIRRLRNELPLSKADGTSLVEAPGGDDAGWGKKIGADPVDRQFLLMRARPIGGKMLYTATGFSFCKRTDTGDSTMGKKDADAAQLTYTPTPDGIFMAMQDGEYVPVIKYEWVGGALWDSLHP